MATAAPERGGLAASQRSCKVTVLVADDSPDSREILKTALELHPDVCVVAEAGDGADAVAAAMRTKPDLVFLDVAMPGMDGLEAAGRIRAERPDTRIVMLSAYDARRMDGAARAAGADAYLEKAAGIRPVLRLVRDLFPRVADRPAPASPPSPPVLTADVLATLHEQRFHLLLDALEEGVLLVSRGNTVLSANFAAARMFGVGTSELVGADLARVVPSNGADGDLVDIVRTALDSGRPRSGAIVGIGRPDGSRRWAQVAVRPLVAGGPGQEVLVSLSDVTDLHETQERYRALVASFPEAIVAVFDRDARVQLASGQCLPAGLRPEDATGRLLPEVLDPMRAEAVAAAVHAAFSGEETTSYLPSLSEPGEMWLVRVVPVRAPDGTVMAALLVAEDVTERIEAEVALRESEVLFRTTVEMLPDGVGLARAVRDDDGRIVDFVIDYVNPAGWAILRRAPEEIIGHRLGEVLPEVRGAGVIDDLVRMVDADERLVRELSWLDGATLSGAFEYHAAPLVDGFVVSFSDVTTRFRAAQALVRQADELRRANEQLRRSNETLQYFAQIASHDLRQPLVSVAGFAELLRMRWGDRLDDEGRRYLDVIFSNVERMHSLVSDLLAHADPEVSRASFGAVDLGQCLSDALAMLSQDLADSNATITVDELPVVHGDPVQLAALFQNLLANAVAYVPLGVTPAIAVSAERDGRMWRVVVADNGLGFPEQGREQAFEMFHRFHPVAGRRGTGIGLATCKRIVDLHGGHIWIEDNRGGGSRVCFTVPVRSEARHRGYDGAAR